MTLFPPSQSKGQGLFPPTEGIWRAQKGQCLFKVLKVPTFYTQVLTLHSSYHPFPRFIRKILMDTKVNNPFCAQKSQRNVKATVPSHSNDRETFIHCSKLTVTHPFTEVFSSFLTHLFERILCMCVGVGTFLCMPGVCVSVSMKTKGLCVVP